MPKTLPVLDVSNPVRCSRRCEPAVQGMRRSTFTMRNRSSAATIPFLSMDNVLCTPHLGWAEWDNFELYFRECFEQIVAYAEGAPMRLVGTE